VIAGSTTRPLPGEPVISRSISFAGMSIEATSHAGANIAFVFDAEFWLAIEIITEFAGCHSRIGRAA
jgi:hypothetical protein